MQRRGLELNPKDSLAYYNLGRMLFQLGRYDEALAVFETAHRLDPAFVGVVCYIADILIESRGDVAAARRAIASMPAGLQEDRLVFYRYWMAYLARDSTEALRVIQNSPLTFFHDNDYSGPREFLEARALALAGDRPAAVAKYRIALGRLDQDRASGSHLLGVRALAAAAVGDEKQALDSLRSLENGRLDLPGRDEEISRARAEVYTALGRQSEALDALEHLAKTAGKISPASLRIDPTWDPLRKNPRFQELLRD
jgi:tetratricopeptide (TPR) repeat protein